MKKLFVIVILITVLISCQDSKENASQKLPKQYDRQVGEQIPLDVAKRWIANFSGTNSAGRIESTFSIDAQMLSKTLGSLDDKLGVIMHHATDENNSHHLLIFTMSSDGELFHGIILDALSGLTLDEETARSWASRYADAHPATPWYHFFGSDVFSEIQSNEAFNYVDIFRGLNENNEEQVLLFVYNTKGVSGGRIEGEGVTVYDASYPCPPCSSN